MKFQVNFSKIGDVKIAKKFLWFPVCIDHEIRWLETATIKYQYSSRSHKVGISDGWVAVEFIKGEQNGN